jgi:trigger factor
VKPLTEPEVKIVAPENTQELRFKMIVHKAPEVELGLIRGVELTQYFTNITDEEVDKEIQHELLMHGELEPSPGSRVEVEDVAILEVVVAKDGELIPGAESVELKGKSKILL